MTEIEFAALLVSRVCHDLVGPLGAVVNGMEVLEDERDAAMREDAIKLVTITILCQTSCFLAVIFYLPVYLRFGLQIAADKSGESGSVSDMAGSMAVGASFSV